MRAEQRRKILIITAVVTLGICFRFIYPLEYFPLWQRLGISGFVLALMLITVWIPTRKRHRRRRTRSGSNRAENAKYEQLS